MKARVLACSLVVVILALCMTGAANTPAGEDGRYNVLLIVIDTVRADHLPCYGYARDTAPNICALAAKGTLFNRSISQAAWTKPSVASLFTSNYPFEHKTGKGSGNSPDLDSDYITLAEKMRENGYGTVAVVGNQLILGRGYDQGFDSYVSTKGWARQGIKSPKWWVRYGYRFFSQYVRNGFRTDRSEDIAVNPLFLESLKDVRRPFFGYLHYMSPHATYCPPAEFDVFDELGGDLGCSYWLDMKKGVLNGSIHVSEAQFNHLIAKYDGEILYVDHLVGELLGELEETGELEDTLIIVTADHGEEFLEHGWLMHASFQLYPELIHVPLILALDGVVEEGRVRNGLVETIDVAPTILEIIGVEGEPSFKGESLFSGREFAVSNSIDGTITQSIEDEWHKLIVRYEDCGDGKRFSACRELYDIASDPAEKEDIYDEAEHNETIRRLEALMLPPFKPDHERYKQDEETISQLRALGYL